MKRYPLVLLTILVTLGAFSSRGAAEEEGEISAEAQTAIQAIEELGGSVRQIAANVDERDVAFHLGGTELTDDGLQHVRSVPQIVWLNLRGTKITDAGLEHLKEIETLRRLHLEKTAVGDAGLEHLKGLSNLEYLNLYGTKVTDAGLAHLEGLTNLKKLYLWQTEVTDEGVDKLATVLADVEIVRGADLEKLAALQAIPQKVLAKGQFVRIRLVGPEKILSLAEVEIIEKGTGTVLTEGKEALQSSDHEEAVAGRAIDGNTEQEFAKGSVTHTQTSAYPWWQVDLGGEYEIGKISVHNRAEEGGRLQGALVEVLDPGHQIVWVASVDEGKDGSVHHFQVEE